MQGFHRFYPFHSILVDDSISSWSSSWRAILAELMGTMLFTFVSGAAVVATNTFPDSPSGSVLLVALASGLAYMALIFNFWNLSGGHLNPAVTWGALIARRIGLMKGVAYIAAQCVGGIFGALLVAAATPQADQGHIGMHIWSENLSSFDGFLLETIVTFILVHTFFATSFDSVGMGRLSPIPIGFVLTFGYLITWRFTGPTTNPARTLGIAIVTGHYHHQWLYWLAPIAGSTLAALLYALIFMTRPIREDEIVSSIGGEPPHFPHGTKRPEVVPIISEQTPLIIPSGVASV